jgi:hypothetical protein
VINAVAHADEVIATAAHCMSRKSSPRANVVRCSSNNGLNSDITACLKRANTVAKVENPATPKIRECRFLAVSAAATLCGTDTAAVVVFV